MRVILVNSSSGSNLTQLATQINKHLCLVSTRSNSKTVTWAWCSIVKMHFIFFARKGKTLVADEWGEKAIRKIIPFLCWSVSLLLSKVDSFVHFLSNLSQAVGTKKKSSLNDWWGPLCHQLFQAVSSSQSKTALVFGFERRCLGIPPDDLWFALVWRKCQPFTTGNCSPSPFWLFPWCQTGNVGKSIVALFLLYQGIRRGL